MIQIFSLTLGANEAREVAVSGEYFELRNALYPVALIELLDRSGGVVSRLENPEQSDYVKPGRYETIRVTNGPTAQTIRHFYGSGDAGSRRTSGQVQVLGTVGVTGDVSVIDNEKSRVIAGNVFASALAQAAANYATLQLWNPAASGKNVIVSPQSIGLNVGGTVVVSSGAVALTSDVTATRAANLKLGGGMGVAQSRIQDMATPYGYANGSIVYLSLAAGVPFIWNSKSPLVIGPGFGLNIHSIDLGKTVLANLIYREEPV